MTGRNLILASSALASALTALHAMDEGDVYWHLALGRAVVRSGSRVVPEPYAIDMFGEPRVVPEWLWGVLTWGVQELGGYTALTWLAVALAAALGLASAFFIDRLVHEANAQALTPLRLPAQALLTAASIVLVSSRARLRPELLAGIILPVFLWQSRQFFAGEAHTRVKRGIVLTVLSVLWGQVHGSFVLAPALFACSGVSSLSRRELRRAGLMMIAVLTLSWFSCAHGLHVFSYILEHSGTDATRHITDMAPGRWQDLNPVLSVWGCAMTGLLFLWVSALALGKAELGDLGLALLVLAMFGTATRFGALFGVLGAPLAVRGVLAIAELHGQHSGVSTWRARVLAALCLGSALLMVVSSLRALDQVRPLFRTGMSHSVFPLRGARALLAREPPVHVYSSVRGGAALGYLGDGRLRVIIDSRIPLHFGDAFYGVYRDVTADPLRLPMYFRRYRITAAVVERKSPACSAIESGMRLLTVDPSHATFVLGEGSELPGIDPCGVDHIERGCGDPRALRASIAQLSRQLDDDYTRWLTALAGLECKTLRPDSVVAMLPSERALPSIADAVVRSRVRALWQAGRRDEALHELARGIADVDARAISVISELWGGDMPIATMRKLYGDAVRDMDDDTPARERGKLALLCLATSDFDCATFQGLRAAVGGDMPARAVLEQLVQMHPSREVRSDLKAWLRVLPDAPPPTGSEPSAGAQ